MRRLIRFVRAHPLGSGIGAVAVVAVLGFGLYWFGPQHLFFDRTVDEALPSLAGTQDEGTDGDAGATDGGGMTDGSPAEAQPPAEEQPSGPEVLARGSFRSLEHEGTGTALALELPDGTRFVRFEDFEVLSGPDLRVYLSAEPASADPSRFDDDFVDLGGLKGNVGNQNYELGAKVNLEDYRSVVIWCRRFSVGFAVAPLEAA